MVYDEFIFLNNSTIYVKFASNFAVEKISQLLQAKGMRPEIAVKRAISVYGKESEKATLYFHNFQVCFGKNIMKNIYEYVANKALFQEKIHFGSYDQMLGLVQHVFSSSLSEAQLKEVRRVSQANSYAVALVY